MVDKSLGRENKIVLSDYSDAKSMAQIFNEYFFTQIANISVTNYWVTCHVGTL